MYITKANDNVVKHIIEKIKEKSDQNAGKIIVTIDGDSGCSKTSIARRIGEIMGDNAVSIVTADYFINPWSEILKNISEIKSAPQNLYEKYWYSVENIDEMVGNFLDAGINENNDKSRGLYRYESRRFPDNKKIKRELSVNLKNKILIIEGCFISHEKILGDRSDLKIFLSLDKETLKNRREKRREVRKVKKNSKHNDLVTGIFHSAFENYLGVYNPVSKSDLNINIYTR